MNFWKSIRQALGIAVIILIVPSAALAVSASSGDGNGSQNVTSWHLRYWTATGNLRSAAGRPVYPSGKVEVGGPDQVCGRYASDTTSRSYVTRGGSCNAGGGFQVQGMQWRVCRNINNAPDSCGGWSASIKQ